MPIPRQRGPLEKLASFPYACRCGTPLQELSHQGRHFHCDSCKILYKKHRDHGIEPVWITRDNRCLPLSEIETRHLKNIVGKMVVQGGWREQYMGLLLAELELRLLLEQPQDNDNG